MTATVVIRREILDVEVHGTDADGLALQRRLPGVCADALAPALESALARVDPGDTHLLVERLEIDLSGISLQRLDAELVDAVAREVTAYFGRQPVPTAAVAAPEVGGLERRTVAETIDDALVVFIRTGRLPWSFRVPPGSKLEQLVLDAWGASAGERGPPLSVLAQLSKLLALPTARSRLVLQFTPGFVAIVLRGMAPSLVAPVEEILAALDELPSLSPRAAFARRVWDAALVAGAMGRRAGSAELARTAWRTSTPVEREHHPLASIVERRWPGVTEQPDSSGPHRDEGEEQPAPASSVKSSALPQNAGEDPDGILVDNAGVVLLHPFLPRFFDGLGVATGDELVDPGRALCLLHHLATGELTAPEHQLVLAKVLCGMPLDDPAEADVGLTDAETAEATALLDAAIGHWGALGGSSADALRGEFMMRPGMLAVDDLGDWLLRVEARTVDILLDQLPWGVSLVKLPWMDRLLRVEWR